MHAALKKSSLFCYSPPGVTDHFHKMFVGHKSPERKFCRRKQEQLSLSLSAVPYKKNEKTFFSRKNFKWKYFCSFLFVSSSRHKKSLKIVQKKMATDVLTNFGTIEQELEKAKSNLKGLNENIRRMIGRDPPDIQLRLEWSVFFRFLCWLDSPPPISQLLAHNPFIAV